MIAGQSPKRIWQPNPDGSVRTIEEAVAIAQNNGVIIPDEVVFHVDESGELHQGRVAKGCRVFKMPGKLVFWSDLIHDLTGKIPFLVWPGILASDEAIVATLAHEMHELNNLRPLLDAGDVAIEDFITHTEPGRPGNLHDQAWDVADQFVDRMRSRSGD